MPNQSTENSNLTYESSPLGMAITAILSEIDLHIDKLSKSTSKLTEEEIYTKTLLEDLKSYLSLVHKRIFRQFSHQKIPTGSNLTSVELIQKIIHLKSTLKKYSDPDDNESYSFNIKEKIGFDFIKKLLNIVNNLPTKFTELVPFFNMQFFKEELPHIKIGRLVIGGKGKWGDLFGFNLINLDIKDIKQFGNFDSDNQIQKRLIQEYLDSRLKELMPNYFGGFNSQIEKLIQEYLDNQPKELTQEYLDGFNRKIEKLILEEFVSKNFDAFNDSIEDLIREYFDKYRNETHVKIELEKAISLQIFIDELEDKFDFINKSFLDQFYDLKNNKEKNIPNDDPNELLTYLGIKLNSYKKLSNQYDENLKKLTDLYNKFSDIDRKTMRECVGEEESKHLTEFCQSLGADAEFLDLPITNTIFTYGDRAIDVYPIKKEIKDLFDDQKESILEIKNKIEVEIDNCKSVMFDFFIKKAESYVKYLTETNNVKEKSAQILQENDHHFKDKKEFLKEKIKKLKSLLDAINELYDQLSGFDKYRDMFPPLPVDNFDRLFDEIKSKQRFVSEIMQKQESELHKVEMEEKFAEAIKAGNLGNLDQIIQEKNERLDQIKTTLSSKSKDLDQLKIDLNALETNDDLSQSQVQELRSLIPENTPYPIPINLTELNDLIAQVKTDSKNLKGEKIANELTILQKVFSCIDASDDKTKIPYALLDNLDVLADANKNPSPQAKAGFMRLLEMLNLTTDESFSNAYEAHKSKNKSGKLFKKFITKNKYTQAKINLREKLLKTIKNRIGEIEKANSYSTMIQRLNESAHTYTGKMKEAINKARSSLEKTTIEVGELTTEQDKIAKEITNLSEITTFIKSLKSSFEKWGHPFGEQDFAKKVDEFLELRDKFTQRFKELTGQFENDVALNVYMSACDSILQLSNQKSLSIIEDHLNALLTKKPEQFDADNLQSLFFTLEKIQLIVRPENYSKWFDFFNYVVLMLDLKKIAELLSEINEKMSAQDIFSELNFYQAMVGIFKSKLHDYKRDDFITSSSMDQIKIDVDKADALYADKSEIYKKKLRSDVYEKYSRKLNKYVDDRLAIFTHDALIKDDFSKIKNTIENIEKAFLNYVDSGDKESFLKFISDNSPSLLGWNILPLLDEIAAVLQDKPITPRNSFAAQDCSDLYEKINVMSKYGKSLKDKAKGQIAIDLAEELKSTFIAFFKLPENEKDLDAFSKQFNTLLHSQDKIMGAYRAYWKVIVANIAVAFAAVLSGVGIFAYAGYAIYNKAKGKSPVLFSNTKRQKQIKEIEKHIHLMHSNRQNKK